MSTSKDQVLEAIGSFVAMSARPLHLLRFGVPLLLELGRVRFLVYSPIAYAAGVTSATSGNPAAEFTTKMFLWGQAFVSCTHMLTHFFNEYYDFEADCQHQFPSPWTGGSRVLVNGRVAPAKSFWLGCLLALMSMSMVLGVFPSWESKLIGAVIVVFSIGYSAPPLELGMRGLGEADVMLVLNLLVPILGYSLFRSEESSWRLLLAMLPPAIVEFVRMMVMNMADVVGDTRARKLTLVVRLGLDRSAAWHMIGMTAAYLTLVAIFLSGYMQLAPFLLQLCTLPMAASICYRLYVRKDYLSLVKFYNLPFVSTQHNGLILIAALLGLVWSDAHRGVSSSLSQQRLLAVYFFFAQFAFKAWKGWQNQKLASVFNPQIPMDERATKSSQITQWEQGLALAARPFDHANKQN